MLHRYRDLMVTRHATIVVTDVRYRLARRFLLGAHDVEAFAADLTLFSASRDALKQVWQQLGPG